MTPMALLAHNMQYFNEITRAPQAHWATDNEVMLETDAFILRYFQGGPTHASPVLIVPPQAGHGSDIADFDVEQSLVRTAMKSGRAVYCIDWKSCTVDRRNEDIDALIQQVMDATRYIHSQRGRRITIVGLCMGGWVSAIAVRRYSQFFDHLIVAGSPIDAHGEAGVIQEVMNNMPQHVYQSMVMMGGGLMRGQFMLMGWKAGNFIDRYLGDYIKLYNTVGTDDLPRLRRFRDWYEKTYDLAGKWYLQAVDLIFRKNLLWQGKLVVHGEAINLQTLTIPATSIAGENDDITPPGQALALPGRHYIIPGAGHIGIFMSRKSQVVWMEVFKNESN